MISRKMRELIESVRQYSRSQTSFWRQVPHLAFEAQGKTGFSAQYTAAYRSGLWPLAFSAYPGNRNVTVYLATGDLLHTFRGGAADDVDVLALAANLDHLDARALVFELNAESKNPPESYMLADYKKWRADELYYLEIMKLRYVNWDEVAQGE